MSTPTPNQERLMRDLFALAEITEPDTPGWTRRFPSAAYLQGREWLRAQFVEAGLETWIDAGANLFGRRAGSATLPPILIGSHTDTVLGGGRYDGPLGTLAALEAARCIAEAGIMLRHPLIVADYLAEEPNAWGVSCVGSRAMVGALERAWLDRTANGITLRQAIMEAGGKPDELTGPLVQSDAIAAALELHIEQGPVLEARGVGLAAVSGIVGIRRGSFALRGRADHAGTTPMALRHDALAAAAALTLHVESLCRAEPLAVGTVGRLDVQPNQANVIAGAVTLTAEIRSIDDAIIERLWRALLAQAQRACDERGVTLELTAQTDTPPAVPPAWLLDAVHSACRSLDPDALLLPSGAGHDTSQLARIAPAAMIFVPSIGGRSHCPDEETAPEHCALGAAALVRAVLAVDTVIG